MKTLALNKTNQVILNVKVNNTSEESLQNDYTEYIGLNCESVAIDGDSSPILDKQFEYYDEVMNSDEELPF